MNSAYFGWNFEHFPILNHSIKCQQKRGIYQFGDSNLTSQHQTPQASHWGKHRKPPSPPFGGSSLHGYRITPDLQAIFMVI